MITLTFISFASIRENTHTHTPSRLLFVFYFEQLCTGYQPWCAASSVSTFHERTNRLSSYSKFARVWLVGWLVICVPVLISFCPSQLPVRVGAQDSTLPYVGISVVQFVSSPLPSRLQLQWELRWESFYEVGEGVQRYYRLRHHVFFKLQYPTFLHPWIQDS